ncbi:unnamed protein product [Durusdinium trenchii]|uniref:Uncharacterized protein n=1 Tax=Durusdinium trenchii TaxID=1381693 RepID=A0ABP0HM18_9DINO
MAFHLSSTIVTTLFLSHQKRIHNDWSLRTRPASSRRNRRGKQWSPWTEWTTLCRSVPSKA